MTQSANTATTSTLSADEVALYLTENPEFFHANPDLLREIQIPTDEGTISLIDRQRALLREEAATSSQKLAEFVASATQNSEIFDKSRTLILDLIAAADADEFFNAMEKSFRDDFNCAAYQLILFSDTPQQVNHFTSNVSETAASEFIGGLLRAKQPTLGVLRPDEQDFLFRHQSDAVRSAAVIPVRKNRQIALLALGSGDVNYFQAGMGTLFLGFIADVLAQLVPKFIYLKHQ